MDVSLVMQQGDAVLIGVFALLLAMSLGSWWLILQRSLVLARLSRQARQWSRQFWAADSLDSARGQLGSPLPHARIATAGLEGLDHYRQHAQRSLGAACGLDEFLVRTIRMALSRETGRLESGLTWLATVGSIAPFVGLFGTVWGIYHALVATAAGLFAAIPAVVAYNAFTRVNRVLSQDMDSFAHDLHAQLLTVAGGEHGLR